MARRIQALEPKTFKIMRPFQEAGVHRMIALASLASETDPNKRMARETELACVAWCKCGSAHSLTVADIFAGSGKELFAIASFRTLYDLGAADVAIVFTPNMSLVDQFSTSFTDVEYNPDTVAWPSDNVEPLLRDHGGKKCIAVVASYQALFAAADKYVRLVKRCHEQGKRVVLVLDEAHHLALQQGWHSALMEELYCHPAVVHRIVMSGTLMRWDGEEIPVVPYRLEDGKKYPIVNIHFSLAAAINAKVVCPFSITLGDGHTTWDANDGEGEVHKQIAAQTNDKDAKRAIRGALKGPEDTDEEDACPFRYRLWLTEKGIEHWNECRRKGHRTRMVVVCANRKAARRICRNIMAMDKVMPDGSLKKIDAVLAIMPDKGEKDVSKAVISSFQGGSHDVLVTVGMAYEGLNVPDVKHVILLTNSRSTVILTQAASRANRALSGMPYDNQRAYIFAMDDKLTREWIDFLRAEGALGIAVKRTGKGPPVVPPPGGPPIIFTESDGGPTRREVVISHAAAVTAMEPIPDVQMTAVSEHPVTRASIRRECQALRKEINEICTRRDRRLVRGATMRQVHGTWRGLAIAQMSIDQLRDVLAYVRGLVNHGEEVS